MEASLALGYELPPFPASSSSSCQPRPNVAPALSRHNSFSNAAPSNLPTDFALPPPATQRDPLSSLKKTWSHGVRPKAVARAVIIAMLVFGGLSLVYRSSSSLLPTLKIDSLSTSIIRQELVDVEKISMVGGKKVRVTGQQGAPRTLTYSDQHQAIGESNLGFSQARFTYHTLLQLLLELTDPSSPTHLLPPHKNSSRSNPTSLPTRAIPFLKTLTPLAPSTLCLW